METPQMIELVEDEWDPETGFFGLLRNGRFDPFRFARCKQLLVKIESELPKDDQISRRLVSLIWYIPMFMDWQADRLRDEIGRDEYLNCIGDFQGIIEQILGVP